MILCLPMGCWWRRGGGLTGIDLPISSRCRLVVTSVQHPVLVALNCTVLTPQFISTTTAFTCCSPHHPRGRSTSDPIPLLSDLTAPPFLPSPIPISCRHISSLIVPLLLFGPAARHADEDEEEKRNCGCEADHDGFAVNAEVHILVGVGGSGAFCWCSGGCDNRGSERCSCHGDFCLG